MSHIKPVISTRGEQAVVQVNNVMNGKCEGASAKTQSARSRRRQRQRENKRKAEAKSVAEMSDEEYERWIEEQNKKMEEEQDRLDEYEDLDYEYNHRDVVAWARQSSEAAFDYFVKSGGVQLRNRDFIGRKAGAPLRSEWCDDGEYDCNDYCDY